MAKLGWRVALLTYDGVWTSSVYPALDLFQSVNLRRMTQLFSSEIISPSPDPVLAFNGRLLAGDNHIGNPGEYDLVILPHFWGDFDKTIQQYPQLPPWLAHQYANGAVIAGINGGIFWAAEAGLLDLRNATTHWRHLREFKVRYPNVSWQENQALVEDGEIYSSNGQNAGMDLTIYLVEKFCGADIAAGLARDITYDSRRNYNLTLFNIAGLRQHKDPGIHKAQEWLDNHYQDEIIFENLAEQVGMSKRTFIRRFQKATGNKPTRYLQRLRVEAAKHHLINSDDSIKTISLNVGYRDFGHFSEVFKSITELSPRQFRSRFRPAYKDRRNRDHA